MKEAVKNLGATFGATQNSSRGQKTAEKEILAKLARVLLSGASIGNLNDKAVGDNWAKVFKRTDECHRSGKSGA